MCGFLGVMVVHLGPVCTGVAQSIPCVLPRLLRIKQQNIICRIESGISSDANTLIGKVSLYIAQKHKMVENEMATLLCNGTGQSGEIFG